MKKLLFSLTCFSVMLSGVGNASALPNIDLGNRIGMSSGDALVFSKGDLVADTVTKKHQASELPSSSKYWPTVRDSSWKTTADDRSNVGAAVAGGDLSVTYGSFSKTFTFLSAATAYTPNYVGNWSGGSGGTLATESSWVGMLVVLESKTYAKLLAALGIIGAIARRRGRA